jgi:hypothetical protein
MSNTPSTTTNSTVHAIKKFATAAAIAGALGLAALGMANGTAAAAPADDSGSTTSAASEQAGPSSPSAGPSSPTAGPTSPTGDSDGSAIPAKSAPTASPAAKTTNTPTSTVGNGRQPGDSADDTSSAVTPSTETTNVFKQSIPHTVNQFEGRPDAQYPIATPLWNLTPQQ